MIAVFAMASLFLAQGPSGCEQAVTARDAAEFCLADQQVRYGESQPKAQQPRQFEEAAEHARRAASLATTPDVKARAMDLLARIYDEQHLNQPEHEQSALVDLVALRPNDVAPVDRLSRVLERIGLPDAAEDVLLAAHQRQPNAVEPERLLAQFFARRVTALHRAEDAKKPQPQLAADQADEKGIYRVGGAIAAPTRVDRAIYPQEARDAGIEGVVILEVVINERGLVEDTKVLRSVPLLDQPAITSAQRWQFVPATLNGQAVKVRMTVTQNFTLK